MPKYRREDLDLSTRMQLGLEMMQPAAERGWGRATELARATGLSRTWLYQLGDRARAALEAALQPGRPGRPAEQRLVQVDRDYVRQAISVLPLLTGSVRSIQLGLEMLFGVERSLGYISQTLQSAGAAAQAHNAALRVPLPVLGEADEIFAGRQPCLTVVDGRSFLVLNLAAATGRDATHWGLTFLDLEAQGIVFRDVAADGARGIRAGLAAAELAVPLRPDLFHLLREGTRLQNSLEQAAFKAIRQADKARPAAAEAGQTHRRRRRGRKIGLSLEATVRQETRALATHDHFAWLLSEIRQVLEPVTPDHRLQDPQLVQATLAAACELLESLPGKKLTTFAGQLRDHLDELLAPLVWLQEHLAAWRNHLPPALEAWMISAWRCGRPQAADFPPAWQPTAVALWEALSLFHRSSSLAEALHSWLRPYLSIHRGMPEWLLPLLQLFWNHHAFTRGKRAGRSPLEWAGVAEPDSVASVFAGLLMEPQPA